MTTTGDRLLQQTSPESLCAYEKAIRHRCRKTGEVGDLLDYASDKALNAVPSVGGFGGISKQLVVVPFRSLLIVDKRIMLPGGTKLALMEPTEFKYAAN